MEDSTIKLVKSVSCPGRTAVEEILARGHLSYGIDAVDLPEDDAPGFANNATNLVLRVKFRSQFAHAAMEQVLGLAVFAVATHATILEYHWIDGGFSGNPDKRYYLVRIAWES